MVLLPWTLSSGKAKISRETASHVLQQVKIDRVVLLGCVVTLGLVTGQD